MPVLLELLSRSRRRLRKRDGSRSRHVRAEACPAGRRRVEAIIVRGGVEEIVRRGRAEEIKLARGSPIHHRPRSRLSSTPVVNAMSLLEKKVPPVTT